MQSCNVATNIIQTTSYLWWKCKIIQRKFHITTYSASYLSRLRTVFAEEETYNGTNTGLRRRTASDLYGFCCLGKTLPSHRHERIRQLNEPNAQHNKQNGSFKRNGEHFGARCRHVPQTRNAEEPLKTHCLSVGCFVTNIHTK